MDLFCAFINLPDKETLEFKINMEIMRLFQIKMNNLTVSADISKKQGCLVAIL